MSQYFHKVVSSVFNLVIQEIPENPQENMGKYHQLAHRDSPGYRGGIIGSPGGSSSHLSLLCPRSARKTLFLLSCPMPLLTFWLQLSRKRQISKKISTSHSKNLHKSLRLAVISSKVISGISPIFWLLISGAIPIHLAHLTKSSRDVLCHHMKMYFCLTPNVSSTQRAG